MDMLVTLPGGKKVTAQYKGFTIQTDQPESDGGEGSAASPFDLFLTSIGTCAGYYVLAFCQSRQIPTQGISVGVTFQRSPEKKLVETIAIEILLPADFPDKYKEAVVRAAETCTVKKHLAHPPTITITAQKPQGRSP
jgi:ribosomal protein S12 methylthiotransferase accessory factor